MVFGLLRRHLDRNVELLHVGELVEHIPFLAADQNIRKLLVERLQVIVPVYLVDFHRIEEAMLVRELPKRPKEIRVKHADDREDIDQFVLDRRAGYDQCMS